MVLRKCPKCELNYLKEGEKFCSVCSGKMKNLIYNDEDEEIEICPTCGERPVAHGEEYCSECLAELTKNALGADNEAKGLSDEDTPEVLKVIDSVDIDEPIEVPTFDISDIKDDIDDVDDSEQDDEDADESEDEDTESDDDYPDGKDDDLDNEATDF